MSQLTRKPLTGRPEAELWLGAHPSAPASVMPNDTPLDAWIAVDPDAAVGPEVARRFDGLPFLLKILAAGQPLSLQAHPSAAAAATGFAAEEAAQVAIDDPQRTFKDPHHKPELICAVSEFRALCGFRESSETLDLIESVGASVLEPVAAMLRHDRGSDGLRRVLKWVLSQSGDAARNLVAALADSSGLDPDDQWCAERRTLAELAARYPCDPAVVAAALLNLVELEPGEALFLGAGNLHAYLDGIGVEILANSDNVVRAGLTAKHVDVELLLDIVDFQDARPIVQRPGPDDAVFRYAAPVPEFSLTRYRVDSELTIDERGPVILFCVEGQCEVVDDSSRILLQSGDAVWRPAEGSPVRAVGGGLVFSAAIGLNMSEE